MVVVISGWEVINDVLFILIVYMFQIFYKHVLHLCSGENILKAIKQEKNNRWTQKKDHLL